MSNRYTIDCGRLYDPSTDTNTTLYPCESWARWEVEGRDGLKHYACGSHINKVLADMVGSKRAQLVVKDMRED